VTQTTPTMETIRRGLSNKEKTKCLALPVQKLRRGSQNLKNRSRDPDYAPLRVIQSSVVLVVAYLPKKKNEVSSFTRSNVTEGSQNLKK